MQLWVSLGSWITGSPGSLGDLVPKTLKCRKPFSQSETSHHRPREASFGGRGGASHEGSRGGGTHETGFISFTGIL